MLATAQERIQFTEDKKPLTIGQVRDEVRKLGLSFRYQRLGSFSWEFRINYTPAEGGTEATAYYTEWRDDAIATARMMRKAKSR